MHGSSPNPSAIELPYAHGNNRSPFLVSAVLGAMCVRFMTSVITVKSSDRTRRANDFVLGVDLDGVVADFIAGLHPIAAEWVGRSAEELPLEVKYGFPEWKLDEYGGYEALHRYAVKERDLFRSLPPVANAPAVLRKLSTLGIRIRIITHRLYIEWFHRQAIEQTIDWLERHDIPYWDICFMKQKSAVGAHLYLEDNPSNIAELRSQGCEVIVVVNSTNREVAAPRAESWEEIERLVAERLELWMCGSTARRT